MRSRMIALAVGRGIAEAACIAWHEGVPASVCHSGGCPLCQTDDRTILGVAILLADDVDSAMARSAAMVAS